MTGFKKMKENRGLTIAAVAAILAALLMGSMVIFAQGKAEAEAGDIAEGESIVFFPQTDRNENTLYKDTREDQLVVKDVCKKFGLDYETVTRGEITPEMVDYEFAVSILKDEGDLDLFISPEHDGYAMSLEAYVNDIHAFYGSKPIIESVCERDGIDLKTATIKDMSVEQIQEIMSTAFETSDHGK